MMWHACIAVSNSIGIGHAVRVLALFQRSGIDLKRLWVWTDWSDQSIKHLLGEQEISIVPLFHKSWPGVELPEAIAIDMPDPPLGLLDQTSSVQRKLLLGCSDYRQAWADLTVNVAEGGRLDLPEPPLSCRLWEGARFAMLRAEFLEGRNFPYDREGPILVVIGGTDSAGISLPLVETLLRAHDCRNRRLQVVIKAEHRDRGRLSLLAEEHGRIEIIEPSNAIARLIQCASVVIAAPGNLLFECLALRAPVLVVSQNERQRRDFRRYPWLYLPHEIEKLPAAITRLLSNEFEEWYSYAERAAVGQSFPKLLEWCRSPISDAIDRNLK